MLQVPCILCWSTHIKHKHKGWCHWLSALILVSCNKIKCSVVKFRPVLMIDSIPICINGLVIVLRSIVDVRAEVTQPLGSIIIKPNEWIDISSAVVTPYNWLIFKTYLWMLLSTRMVSKRLCNYSYRQSCIFL
jgi:hypothetical protein